MRADAIRNRQKLLDVAERLFTTKGASTEMDEIAREAGVGVGTIYRHFATKELLLREIVVGPIEALIDRAGALRDAPDPGAAFFELFDELVELATAKHQLVEVFSQGSRVAIGTPEEVQSRHARFRAAFSVLLERAQAAGAVRRDIGVSELVAIVNGAFPYLRRAGGTRKEHLRLLAFVVDGLAATPRSSTRRGAPARRT